MLSHFSRVQLFATPWTVAHRATLSKGFSGQEYWRGCHFCLQGIFSTQGWNPHLFTSPALADRVFTDNMQYNTIMFHLILPEDGTGKGNELGVRILLGALTTNQF